MARVPLPEDFIDMSGCGAFRVEVYRLGEPVVISWTPSIQVMESGDGKDWVSKGAAIDLGDGEFWAGIFKTRLRLVRLDADILEGVRSDRVGVRIVRFTEPDGTDSTS